MSGPKPTLALVHGWGFNNDFWKPLMAALPGFRCLAIGLGDDVCAPSEPIIAVGHSLGFLWLLHERPFPWRTLIAINGFTRFTDGVGVRALRRMVIGMKRSPEKTVGEFMALCGAKPPKTLDVSKLRQGLDWLMNWDESENLAAETAPVLALAGRLDPIVPAAISEAAFAGKLCWHDGGHLLPLTDPGWCAVRIRECL